MTESVSEPKTAKRRTPNWGKALVSLGVCAVVAFALHLTRDVHVLWGLIIIPILYGML